MEDGTPFGRYRLLDLLGRGGMGEVWRTFDTVTERVVALKLLPTQFAHDSVYQERFRREARAAAGLDEPHVVPIHDFGEIEGRLFVTMRLIKGHDLHTIISHGRLDAPRAVGIIDQVASALHAAHDIGLVHRDVKPSNILVGDDDFAYLIDFGIARAAGQAGLTSASSVIGTWAYMAPERITATHTDARADVYALACVLYECLTGSQPFPGDSLEQLIGGHIALPPPRASDRHSDVPTGLDAVIAKGMAKNPDDRYRTTRELARAARSVVSGVTPLPAPVSPTTPAPFVNSYHPPQGPPSTSALTQWRADASTERGSGQPSSTPLSPRTSRKGLLIGASCIAVTAVIAVVAAVVLAKSGNESSTAANSFTTTAEPTSQPNTGPFTGTYTVAFGPKLNSAGAPVPDAPPFTETWLLRSACGDNGCVATASSSGTYSAQHVVFDEVGESWLAVSTSSTTCNGIKVESWNMISLAPQPDGTKTGESTSSTTNGCFDRRTVTFTRTGDVKVSLSDPAAEAPRVPSPAEALRGSYHAESRSSTGDTGAAEFVVQTICLRNGERCISPFRDPEKGKGQTLLFANGKWNRNEEFASKACTTDGNRIVSTGEFLPPQPPQNPIALLTGTEHIESTSASCEDSDLDVKFIRTGD